MTDHLDRRSLRAYNRLLAQNGGELTPGTYEVELSFQGSEEHSTQFDFVIGTNGNVKGASYETPDTNNDGETNKVEGAETDDGYVEARGRRRRTKFDENGQSTNGSDNTLEEDGNGRATVRNGKGEEVGTVDTGPKGGKGVTMIENDADVFLNGEKQGSHQNRIVTSDVTPEDAEPGRRRRQRRGNINIQTEKGANVDVDVSVDVETNSKGSQQAAAQPNADAMAVVQANQKGERDPDRVAQILEDEFEEEDRNNPNQNTDVEARPRNRNN